MKVLFRRIQLVLCNVITCHSTLFQMQDKRLQHPMVTMVIYFLGILRHGCCTVMTGLSTTTVVTLQTR